MSEELQDNLPQPSVISLTGLYENWFLDYASYVILDRAVPHINDGFKPVQRRIIHSLEEMNDGRYNKAANVIGHTMKYHPHGDASIGDAMVQLGQKQLLIECQGNWGDPVTGDSAAAPRYIEARLSRFALDVIFNPQTTNWQLSYDGRNKEPVTFPAKFPVLLAQGAEGIAVGLATKIMPHNFIELIDASVDYLKGKQPDLLPDFYTGGMADCSNYNEGLRGGKVRVRAKITERDKKTLVISEIPFSTTTSSVIDSIIAANEKGKIKIRRIEDNTAQNVEILVHLAPGISPDVTIDALFAFTDCEKTLNPNTCVIKDDKPHFLSVNDILAYNTLQTRNLLKKELEISRAELQERIFFSSLLKIFISEGMYKHPHYEQSANFTEVTAVLHHLFAPFANQFYRPIEAADYKRLIDKPMSSITRFDVAKADELMAALHQEIKAVNKNLKNLTDYTIAWYTHLKTKYGKGKERRTVITNFDRVEAAKVALANTRLYVNRQDGFIGMGLRKDEFITECSDIDDIIAFRRDGKYSISRIAEKTFVGKDIIHAGVFVKNDERQVYNVIYLDGATGIAYAKRFFVTGITREKDYDVTRGSRGSRILYFSANPNGEAEVVTVMLRAHSKLKKLSLDFDFTSVGVKNRAGLGVIVSKYPIKKIILKTEGVSTLPGMQVYFDSVMKRLNTDKRGQPLGEFQSNDKILVTYPDGSYELTGFDLSNHYAEELGIITKYNPALAYCAIYIDGKSGLHYVKRFFFDDLATGRRNSFISEEPGSTLLYLTSHPSAIATVSILKGKAQSPDEVEIDLANFIDVKGIKAQGNRLTPHTVTGVTLSEKQQPTDMEDVASDAGTQDIPDAPTSGDPLQPELF